MAPLIAAFDPGDRDTGWVLADPVSDPPIRASGITVNDALIERILAGMFDGVEVFAIEWARSFGARVGNNVFDMIHAEGRFDQALRFRYNQAPVLIARRDVKLWLLNSVRGNDADVNHAVATRYGGDMKTAKGTAKNPGPLFKLKSHVWPAFAVAVVYAENPEWWQPTRAPGTRLRRGR